MNILVFCDEDLGVAGGGAQQVVQFVRALEARGHIVAGSGAEAVYRYEG